MADHDVRVDQSSDDAESTSGGGSTGSGGTGDGQGAGASDKDASARAPSGGSGDGGSAGDETPPSGGADDVDPLGDPKDGPATIEDDGGDEGLTGAGGGGSSSGGLFGDIGDAVSDAYDDVEDAANDAADDVGDAAAGAYDKVEGGAASLGHDIEHEVAKNWEDAGTWDREAFGEHRGGLADPWGTANAPFQAADRAYDAVEDDIAKAYDDTEDAVEDAAEGVGLEDMDYDLAGGMRGTYRDAEDEVRDAYNDSALSDHLAGYDVINAAELGLVYGPGIGATYVAGKVADNEGWDREAEDAANDAAGNAAEGDAGSARDLDFGSGAPPVADEGLGRDDVPEPADPLAPVDDVEWDVTRPVAEQAGEEDAQDAASELEGLLDDPGPVSVPGPGETDGLELD